MRTPLTAPDPSSDRDDFLDPGAEPEVDAVRRMQVAIDGRNLIAEHPTQGQRVHFNDRHGATVLPGRGGRLQADPAGPDHHHVPAFLEPLEQHIRLIQGAQVMHALQVGTRSRQRPHPGTGGQQQLVVIDGVGRVHGDGLRRQIEADRDGSRAPFDVVLHVPLRFVQIGLLAGVRAEQVPLRQRWALVGRLGFLADQHHPAGESPLTQRLRGLCSGQ